MGEGEEGEAGPKEIYRRTAACDDWATRKLRYRAPSQERLGIAAGCIGVGDDHRTILRHGPSLGSLRSVRVGSETASLRSGRRGRRSRLSRQSRCSPHDSVALLHFSADARAVAPLQRKRTALEQTTLETPFWSFPSSFGGRNSFPSSRPTLVAPLPGPAAALDPFSHPVPASRLHEPASSLPSVELLYRC